jgi:hypothetical protein
MTGSEYLKQKSHSPLLLCSSSSLNSTPSLRDCIQTLSLSEMCVGGHPVCVSVIDRVIRLRYYMGVCLIHHTSPINCCHPFESTKEQHKVLDRSFAKWQHHSISGARPLPGGDRAHQKNTDSTKRCKTGNGPGITGLQDNDICALYDQDSEIPTLPDSERDLVGGFELHTRKPTRSLGRVEFI